STAAALQAAVPAGGALTVVVEDAAGNVSAPSAPTPLATDFNPPSLTVSGPVQVRVGESGPVSFVFNKPVGGLDPSALLIGGGTVTNLTGSGVQYTATFAPSPSAGTRATITALAGFARDLAGNPSLRSEEASFRIEPASGVTVVGLSSSTADGAYRVGSVINIEVTFTNVVTVKGIPSLDLAVKPARRAAYASGSGGKVLTFRYEVKEGDRSDRLDHAGVTALSLNGGEIVNLSGGAAGLVLPVPGAAGSLAAVRSIRVDTQSPLVAIRSSRTALKSGETAAITFELSEDSTDFTAADVKVTNGTLGGFTGSGRSYSATVTPDAGISGGIGIVVDAGGFTDAAGNPNLPAALALDDIRFAWASSWGGSVRDEVSVTILDRTGNVYVAGRFSGVSAFDRSNPTATTSAQGGTDAFVSKFDRAGKLLWARSFGGVGADEIRSIAVSPLGSVILTGSFSGKVDFDPGPGVNEITAAGDSDIFVLSLDASGAFEWVRTIGGAGTDSGRAVATDGDGFLYVGGGFQGQVDFDPGAGQRMLGAAGTSDGFLVKLGPAGDFIWAHAIGSSGVDEVRAVAADESGNVFVGGTFSGTVDFDLGAGTRSLIARGTADGFVAKYSPAGDLSWAAQFGRSGEAGVNALAVSSGGSVLVAGNYRGEVDGDPGVGERVLGSEGGVEGFVVKLDSAGAHAWSHRFGGSGDES
ncbi:MAG: Ig-like domain-containing protein, partial [Opitutaceae bacterium]